MKKNDIRRIIVLENIRSAYNVGNAIRTADALGRDVRLSGYSPAPDDSSKVRKTSLGAEQQVKIERFDTPALAIQKLRELHFHIIAAEITADAMDLTTFSQNFSGQDLAIIFGNEIDGVEKSSLSQVDQVVFIPMNGIKESMNIGQSTAIFMWELGE